MGQPRPVFVYFRSFQTKILQKKALGFSGIRTRIVGVEGEHADHLTTTTAQNIHFIVVRRYRVVAVASNSSELGFKSR